jgi:putative methionine-R-sulfoxide reductase with GAF domain
MGPRNEGDVSIGTLAASHRSQGKLASAIAHRIRLEGDYRWVGIYEVTRREIALIGWSGDAPPAHPRFPADQGLCGAAVARAETVIVDDVRSDARYLTTFGTTRSEMVVPIRHAGVVLGIIDVESDRLAAFDRQDRDAVELWAEAAASVRLELGLAH